MTQLRVYDNATVRFDEDDTAMLEVILTRTNADGDIVEEPPDFPLERAKVVFNGANAVISVPQTNRRHRRVCRLTEAKLTDPRRDNDPIVIEGTAWELLAQGFTTEQARVTATIVKYATCATCR